MESSISSKSSGEKEEPEEGDKIPEGEDPANLLGTTEDLGTTKLGTTEVGKTFVRKKTVGGKDYYYLARSIREDGKPKQKVVEYLGKTVPPEYRKHASDKILEEIEADELEILGEEEDELEILDKEGEDMEILGEEGGDELEILGEEDELDEYTLATAVEAVEQKVKFGPKSTEELVEELDHNRKAVEEAIDRLHGDAIGRAKGGKWVHRDNIVRWDDE